MAYVFSFLFGFSITVFAKSYPMGEIIESHDVKIKNIICEVGKQPRFITTSGDFTFKPQNSNVNEYNFRLESKDKRRFDYRLALNDQNISMVRELVNCHGPADVKSY